MGKIRLIGVDLDGTVLDSEKRISPENRAVFRECRERGIYVVPVTGRPVSGLFDEYKREIMCRYSIHTNGAAAVDVERGNELISHSMSRKTAEQVADIIDLFDSYYGIFHKGYGYLESGAYIAELKRFENTPLHRYLLTTRRAVKNSREFLRTIDHCDNIYVIAKDTPERDKIAEAVSGVQDIFFTCSAEDDVEIGGKCSKGSTLIELAGLLGIDKTEVMAIGDSGNDLNMLESAGLAVAMENASPQIKAAADHITGSCEESGVAQAIRKYVFQE